MVTPSFYQRRSQRIKRITFMGSVVNLCLTIGKFIAGFVGHSGAMLADAVHSLSDFLTDIVVFVFASISGKPSDKNHDYGHGKFETLATVIIAVALIFVGVFLCVKGLVKVFDYWVYGRSLARPGLIALFFAAVSVLVKEWLFRKTLSVGREENSQTVVANAWHHRADAYSSIATFIGIAAAFLLGRGWIILEPLAASVVSIFIINVGVRMFFPALRELLEQSLPEEIEEEMVELICSEPVVVDVYRLRTRNIGSYYAVEADIRVDGDMTVKASHAATQRIEALLTRKYGALTHVVIHVEPCC